MQRKPINFGLLFFDCLFFTFSFMACLDLLFVKSNSILASAMAVIALLFLNLIEKDMQGEY